MGYLYLNKVVVVMTCNLDIHLHLHLVLSSIPLVFVQGHVDSCKLALCADSGAVDVNDDWEGDHQYSHTPE